MDVVLLVTVGLVLGIGRAGADTVASGVMDGEALQRR